KQVVCIKAILKILITKPFHWRKKFMTQYLFKEMGALLRQARKASHLSQADVATACDLSSPQFISNSERGICKPSAPVLKTMVKMYGLNPKRLAKLIAKDTEQYWAAVLSPRTPSG